MCRELIHIYGPLSIQSFGLIIAIGLLLFTWLVYHHPLRKKLLSKDQFSSVLLIGILSGIIGGRLLFIAQEYSSMSSVFDIFRIWQGGFSILGTIAGITLALAYYLKKTKIPALPFFDLIAIYAPLFQSISRIGCFTAGCCYGMPTSLPWGITYSDQLCSAPTNIALHPTQLYSSITLFFIFIFMRFVATKKLKKPGQLITLYLALASIERFTIAFWRADRDFCQKGFLKIFSVHQWLALILLVFAITTFVFVTFFRKPRQT